MFFKYCYLYLFIHELSTDAPGKVVKVEILLIYNREMLHSIPGHDTGYNAFCVIFPKSVQENIRIVHPIGHDHFFPYIVQFIILVILTFDVVECEY